MEFTEKLHQTIYNIEEEKLAFQASTHMPFHLCNAIKEKCMTYRKEVKSLEFRRLSLLLNLQPNSAIFTAKSNGQKLSKVINMGDSLALQYGGSEAHNYVCSSLCLILVECIYLSIYLSVEQSISTDILLKHIIPFSGKENE